MAEAGEETVLVVEHRYVCSECSHLSASLEDALLHQQRHLGPPQQHQYELVGVAGELQALAVPESSQYQCLECGQLLVSPGQLLEHQEMHIKLLGQDGETPPASSAGKLGVTGVVSGGIHYECVECKALFSSQEVWLSHRQSHRGGGAAAAAATGTSSSTGVTGTAQGQALVDLEHSYRKQEEEEEEGEEGDGDPGTVQLLLYECGECLQLFQSPKDFLEHQAAHFGATGELGRAKEDP
ncbi:ZN574 protein, partial [Brachypteracias leptosomus]|nr:ZN574 protein [Brachypteracias leptosomus]